MADYDNREFVFPTFNPEDYKKMRNEKYLLEGEQLYIQRDYRSMEAAYTRSAEGGNPYADTRRGWLNFYLLGCEVDYRKAYAEAFKHFYRAASTTGDPLARCFLAEFYRRGIVVREDAQRSFELRRHAIHELIYMFNFGDPFALYFYAYDQYHGIPPLTCDRAKGIRKTQIAAEMGCNEAYIQLTRHIYNGRGTHNNREEALRMLSERAYPELRSYHLLLGTILYGKGDDLSNKDIPKAVEELTTGATMGSVRAHMMLGHYYFKMKEYERSHECFQRIADNFENKEGAKACDILCDMHMLGLGCEQDVELAGEYLIRACELDQDED